MSNNEKNNDEADLEWLNLKKNKGQTPDYIKKAQIENVGSKFMRKFKENPFVPVGALITVGFLGFGLKSMYQGNRMQSQLMMRGRIAAQGFTVVAILGGLFYHGMNAIDEIEKIEKETNLK